MGARADLARYRAELFSVHPEIGRRRSATTLQAADLAAVLPADAALLAYQLGDQQSYGFVVTNRGQIAVEAAILPLGASAVWDLSEAFRSACANPRRRWQTRGQEAQEALLAPLLKHVPEEVKRLVIVPDQALYELPFHALPLSESQALWDRYQVSYAISASLWQQVRAQPPATGRGLLTFANPVFGPLVRSPELTRGSPLAELPGTAVEAQAIVARFADEARVYQREAAREETAKAEAGRYRYLHFATHGILDSANPLYSAVILAEPGPDSQEDGQLEAREILMLPLQADLVTLSACETGRGKVQPGEGLLGLSWAVTAAGARSMVVSQWKVSDAATEGLMASFYGHLRHGQDKAAALRQAALALRAKEAHPFYWAPFTLLGDW